VNDARIIVEHWSDYLFLVFAHDKAWKFYAASRLSGKKGLLVNWCWRISSARVRARTQSCWLRGGYEVLTLLLVIFLLFSLFKFYTIASNCFVEVGWPVRGTRAMHNTTIRMRGIGARISFGRPGFKVWVCPEEMQLRGRSGKNAALPNNKRNIL